MAYQVLTVDNRTVIAGENSALRVLVSDQKEANTAKNSAYCIATQYRIKSGFIPEKVYVFSAVDSENQPQSEANLSELKTAVDFFFTTLLETELYVKEVPRDSTLFEQEALRLYGKQEEINDGTVSVICGSRAE